MGAIFSKVSPIKDKNDGEAETSTMLVDESSPTKFLDPRSPNPFRTPINDLQLKAAKPVIRAQNLTTDEAISTTTVVTPTKLKTKLLRDLGYTLDSMDPRSPAHNRTPIAFNDSIVSDDFSLAGLSLSESIAQTPVKEMQQETFFTPVPEDGKFAVSQIDPRSPSIDIERTPLMLNVLLTDFQQNENSPKAEEVSKKPLEEETATTITGTVKNMIYMDENQEQPMTPNVKLGNAEKVEKVRTPLSCLVNTQSYDSRNDKRFMHNKPMLARTIFKDATANHNANKMNNSSSKIPVLRKSLSKEIN
ncbi:uncharacterized protein LOC119072895 [Bradysia coprophila]|uniref:uncharacterized protein LOC119072895 n=1 Tax=Bradysia coprophila TaxID=38358 RepID=UPI00187D7ACF|nr:uncharacterized protein LOC119072895 [Bradysia coprophila]